MCAVDDDEDGVTVVFRIQSVPKRLAIVCYPLRPSSTVATRCLYNYQPRAIY